MLAMIRLVAKAIDAELMRQYLDDAQASPDFDLAAAAAISAVLAWADDNTPTEKVH